MRRRRRSGGGPRLGVALLVASGLVGAAFFTIRTSSEDPASEQRTLPEPEARVRVEVLNGGGVFGAARQGTDAARAAGFDVVYFGNATSFDHVESEVVDRVGRLDYAEAVAEALGIHNVRSEPDPDLYVDVSVILGSGWEPLPDRDAPEPEP